MRWRRPTPRRPRPTWSRPGRCSASRRRRLRTSADAPSSTPSSWIAGSKFLSKKQSYYPYLHDWQMMVAQGGSEDQAKYLGDAFQELVLTSKSSRSRSKKRTTRSRLKRRRTGAAQEGREAERVRHLRRVLSRLHAGAEGDGSGARQPLHRPLRAATIFRRRYVRWARRSRRSSATAAGHCSAGWARWSSSTSPDIQIAGQEAAQRHAGPVSRSCTACRTRQRSRISL